MATIIPLRGHTPAFGHGCFLAPNATVIGDVTMGDECSVWFGVTLRGDVNTITIDSTFEDLALDSLDVADLVMQIEDEAGITIELDPEVKDMRALVAKIAEAQA